MDQVKPYLKKCPFCGGPADFQDDGHIGYAYCIHCLARTDEFYSWRDKDWKESAARDWNERVSENEDDNTIRDRDRYHEMADRLADAISDVFGIDIGEHSNINSPWYNALDYLEEEAESIKSALDKQIPNKIVFTLADGDFDSNQYRCPTCGEDGVQTLSYCPYCGQKLLD